MKKNICTVLAAIGFSCVLAQPVSAGGWVDDWVSQKSGSGPSSIDGQERGYYSGGNFSARWQNQTTYPVTTSVPHVKSGCGGIDVFMGGFSFMNSDYLVKKLQSIMSSAPAVAFDLGLKTLCEQCSNTIKNLEAMSDTLNGLQMNECAASKSLVATVADASDWKLTQAQRSELGEAISYDKLSSGAADMWTTLTKSQRAANNVPTTGDTQSVTSGCSSDITKVFLQDGLLLANMGNQMGLPSTYIDLMRGLVGDVRLNITQNHSVSYVAPCPQNNPDDLGAVTAGKMFAQDTSENCSQVTDTNGDLTNYVTKELTTILGDMQNKNGLSAADMTFINASPLATLPILKLAIATSTQSETVSNLADLTAKAYALQMLFDLYSRTDNIATKARELLARQNGAVSGQKDSKCADATFAPNIDKNLATMIENIQKVRKGAQASYNTSAAQLATQLQYLQNRQQQEAYVNNVVRKRFGNSAANVIGEEK